MTALECGASMERWRGRSTTVLVTVDGGMKMAARARGGGRRRLARSYHGEDALGVGRGAPHQQSRTTEMAAETTEEEGRGWRRRGEDGGGRDTIEMAGAARRRAEGAARPELAGRRWSLRVVVEVGGGSQRREEIRLEGKRRKK